MRWETQHQRMTKVLPFNAFNAKVHTKHDTHKFQTGLPVPYILEPYRTVPSICEPNRLFARNFRARTEPNWGPQCSRSTMYGSNSVRAEPNWPLKCTVRYGSARGCTVKCQYYVASEMAEIQPHSLMFPCNSWAAMRQPIGATFLLDRS